MAGNKDAKAPGGSILRQASRRAPNDKTNRDSTVLSNTDSTVSMSRSALSSASTKTINNGDSSNSQQQAAVASSVS